MKKTILLLAIFCLLVTKTKAQEAPTLTGSFNKVYFIDMVNKLESQYDLHFYFSPAMDSIEVSLDFSSLSIGQFLDQLTASSGINFLVKENNNIIVTKEFTISTELDQRFFEGLIESQTVDNKEGNAILDNIKEFAEQDKNETLETQIIEIGDPGKRFRGTSAIITGYIRETNTGEPVIGATVYKKDPIVGVITDAFGFYSITLPKGDHELYVAFVGMKSTKRKIALYGNGKLNIELSNDLISLKEIVVTGESNPVENLQTGFATINIKNIKQLPSMMGEADIMKIALTLPGVQSVGEGSSGFNVRGGSVDQNLVLLNDVPVYNTSHLFGFISVFNPNVLSGADLYKSGIGAQYGGRISSVFDVAMREGNKKRFTFQGAISPITANLTFEGPIKKDTSSYIVGLRSTYSDYILRLLDDPALRNSTAGFFDGVTKINYKLNDKNDLIVSGYYSHDNFKLNSDSLYEYSSGNASLQWRHTISNQLHVNSSLSYANYSYSLSSEENPTNAFEMTYHINHFSGKTEFNYFTKDNVNVKFGLSSTLYDIQPGIKRPLGVSLVEQIRLETEKGVESAIYVGAEYEFTHRFSMYGGFRISMFNRLGPGQSFVYQNETPREPEFIVDTVTYANNEMMKTYFGPELRISARYKLMDDLSLKVSYDRMNQYIHILSNTAAVSAIDTWRLSGPVIKPQRGNQYSAGLYKTFFGTSLEMSLEGYYKNVDNMLEYKDGAQLLLNEALETDIILGKGKSYGIEFLLKKNSGKFTGWLSYTYSRSLIQANGIYPVEKINNGEYYPTNYDKPNAALLVSNYKFNRRLNVSFNINYSTGRPATFPIARYTLKGQPVLLYTDRNQYRIPDYFRVDFAINFEGNHKIHKKVHGSWSFSIYNLLGRANAYSVFFKSENGQINGYKLSVFKNAIPSLAYHFRLQ